MSRKIGFQEFLYIGRFWPLERKQIGQDFFCICQYHHVRLTCIKVALHIRQNYARLPDQYMNLVNYIGLLRFI